MEPDLPPLTPEEEKQMKEWGEANEKIASELTDEQVRAGLQRTKEVGEAVREADEIKKLTPTQLLQVVEDLESRNELDELYSVCYSWLNGLMWDDRFDEVEEGIRLAVEAGVGIHGLSPFFGFTAVAAYDYGKLPGREALLEKIIARGPEWERNFGPLQWSRWK